MTPPVDLDAYLRRIGYTSPCRADLDTLDALHQHHAAAIVFEAIDVLLDRGIDLAPEAVDTKLIAAGRGGYCFEQNSLFRRVLETIGFTVEGLAARVRWMQPADAPPAAYSHMALRVTLDGEPWLADVGFGGCVSTTPLRMNTREPQTTPHERFRLVADGVNMLLEAEIDEVWTPVYTLSPEPRVAADYEQANWFTSTHPDSRFRQNLMIARNTPDTRSGLLNNRLTIRGADGRTERRVLDANGIEHALAQIFDLPVEPSWRPVMEAAARADDDVN